MEDEQSLKCTLVFVLVYVSGLMSMNWMDFLLLWTCHGFSRYADNWF